MTGESGVIEFQRRPGEIYSRMVVAALLFGTIGFIVWRMSGFLIAILRAPDAMSARVWLVVLAIVPFTAFMIYLVIGGVTNLRRAFVDRFDPLVTLDRSGVMLHRSNPVAVPWSDIRNAELERGGRGTTILLRLDVDDPGVFEAGKPGRVINLQSLAGDPAELLLAIRSYPSFQSADDAESDSA